MTNVQKIIKNVALAFALLLAFSIISAILGCVISIFSGVAIFNVVSTSTAELVTESFEFPEEQIENIKLDLGAASLTIVPTSEDKIVVEQVDVAKGSKVELDNDTLVINDNKIKKINGNSKINIYIPESKEFNKVEFNIGAGKNDISGIRARKLELDLGAGKAEIKNMFIEDANISAGVGKTEFKNFNVQQLTLDGGVGELTFQGDITEEAEISAGVGRLEINLNSSLEEYKIRTEMGIGSIVLNNNSCANESTYGNGNVEISVEGGMGSIEINTK